MGWLTSLLKDPLGTIGDTVGNFADDPHKSIATGWNSGGRTAAELAAAYFGASYLLGAGGAAGAGLGSAGLGGSELSGAGALAGSPYLLSGSELSGAGALAAGDLGMSTAGTLAGAGLSTAGALTAGSPYLLGDLGAGVLTSDLALSGAGLGGAGLGGAGLSGAGLGGAGLGGAGLGGAGLGGAGLGGAGLAGGINAVAPAVAPAASSWIPGIPNSTAIQGVSSIAGGLISAAGQKQAANTQADAANAATGLQRDIYNQQSALNQPFAQAGLTAQNKLLDLLGLSNNTGAANYGQYAKDFGMNDFAADPGYAFRLSEGQKALDRSAAARGGLISGGALKAATRYGQDMGSQEYQNAYTRYQTNRANQLNPLGSLMSSGQSAVNKQTAAAGNFGTNASNNMIAAGNATAAGQLGNANTINNALGTMASSYQNQSNFTNWLNSQK